MVGMETTLDYGFYDLLRMVLLLYVGWQTHSRPQIVFIFGVVCALLWYCN